MKNYSLIIKQSLIASTQSSGQLHHSSNDAPSPRKKFISVISKLPQGFRSHRKLPQRNDSGFISCNYLQNNEQKPNEVVYQKPKKEIKNFKATSTQKQYKQKQKKNLMININTVKQSYQKKYWQKDSPINKLVDNK